MDKEIKTNHIWKIASAFALVILIQGSMNTTYVNAVASYEGIEENIDTEYDEVLYNGSLVKLPRQPEGLSNDTVELVTEETQHVLGTNFKEEAGKQTRGVTSIHAGDTTRPNRDFVDISSHQPNVSIAQFEAMKKYGVTGVVVKLTEGTSYRNPYARQQVTNAQAAGLKVSTYHFSWFTNKAQAEAEADYYASFAKELGLGSDTIMVNDAENSIMNNGYATTNSVYFALRLINTHKFNSVIHYSSLSWFTSGILDAKVLDEGSTWVAQYLYNPLGTDLRHSQTAAWQWSDGVYFPEISGLEFDMNIDYKGYFISSTGQQDPSKLPLYRLYNSKTGEHHYTLSGGERDSIVKMGWKYEGVGWQTDKSGNSVYRLYNPNSGDHHYTVNSNEKNMLVKLGWFYEGIGWQSGGNIPVYRLYNPNTKVGQHHYTLNSNEKDMLCNAGWKYEGIGFYAN